MALLIGSSPANLQARPSPYSLINYVNERETNISMNSTINPDEISLGSQEEKEELEGKDPAGGQENDANVSAKEESKTPRAPMRYWKI
jgi:hypothetical protein